MQLRYYTKFFLFYHSHLPKPQITVIIQPLNYKIMQTESQRELTLLEQIEQNPDITQASLATQLGVAVGTVNWHIKRLIEKGYVKVKRAERRKLRYIITPEGIALRARLTVDFIEQSFNLYRRVRQRAQEHLKTISESGYDHVRISGNGEVAEICKLTCLEAGIEVVDDKSAPLLEINGMKIQLKMGEKA
mgnify:FL=1|jgi:DNA-binding MarR family transcriptional regulator